MTSDVDLRQQSTSQAFAEDGETPPLVVTQPQASTVQLPLENPVLLAQEFDHVPLLLFKPSEERRDKEMQRNHCASLRHSRRRSSFDTLRPDLPRPGRRARPIGRSSVYLSEANHAHQEHRRS